MPPDLLKLLATVKEPLPPIVPPLMVRSVIYELSFRSSVPPVNDSPPLNVARPDTDRLPEPFVKEIGALASMNLALAVAVEISTVLPKVGMKAISLTSGAWPRLQLPTVPH